MKKEAKSEDLRESHEEYRGKEVEFVSLVYGVVDSFFVCA